MSKEFNTLDSFATGYTLYSLYTDSNLLLINVIFWLTLIIGFILYKIGIVAILSFSILVLSLIFLILRHKAEQKRRTIKEKAEIEKGYERYIKSKKGLL